MPFTNVTTAMTAATPMTTPSKVKTERSLFAHRDCNAMRTASRKCMSWARELHDSAVPLSLAGDSNVLFLRGHGERCFWIFGGGGRRQLLRARPVWQPLVPRVVGLSEPGTAVLERRHPGSNAATGNHAPRQGRTAFRSASRAVIERQ